MAGWVGGWESGCMGRWVGGRVEVGARVGGWVEVGVWRWADGAGLAEVCGWSWVGGNSKIVALI